MERPIRVLLVEDRVEDAELLLAEFRRARLAPHWHCVSSEPDYRASLGPEWDIIIADYSLPQFSGLRALDILQENALDIPLIIVTGSVSEEEAVNCIRKGAADYLLKDRLTRLPSAVKQALEQKRVRDDNLRTYRTLIESEHRFRSLIENGSDGILLLNREGTIVQCYRDLFSGGGRERIGSSLFDWMLPEDRDATRAVWESVSANCIQTLQFRVMDEKGECRWLEAVCNDLSDMPGVGGVVVHYRDITERNRARQEIVRAKDAAETASRAKTNFLAVMSHELRTPMNGIIPLLELLKSTALATEQREYVSTIQHSADTLLGILNDILDFSKIESNSITLETVAFDLHNMLEEVGELLAPKAAGRGLDLITRYAPNSPRRFVADPGRLRQIVINLVDNAIKFTESGYVFINAEALPQAGTAVTMRISVEDTGIGIHCDNFDHIFEKFSQADASTTRKYGGTGLGLAICKRLVEVMGGSIEVSSRLDEGSQFSCTIPLAADPDGWRGAPIIQPNVMRALLVDRDGLKRRVFEEQLRCFGISVATTAGSKEALDHLSSAAVSGRPIEMMFVDDQAPRSEREALSRSVKADPRLRGTRMVALSLPTSRGELRSLLDAGFAGQLVKPVKQSQLIRLLTEASGTVCGDLLNLHPSIGPSTKSSNDPAAQKLRILVAEDNPVNQHVIARILESMNFEVAIVQNGQDAVDLLSHRGFDLILMDCQMPVMDGYRATAEIRRLESSNTRLPIVALTAGAMEGDVKRCLDAGMDDYISKPMKLAAVQEVLERWLPRSASSTFENSNIL